MGKEKTTAREVAVVSAEGCNASRELAYTLACIVKNYSTLDTDLDANASPYIAHPRRIHTCP